MNSSTGGKVTALQNRIIFLHKELSEISARILEINNEIMNGTTPLALANLYHLKKHIDEILEKIK